MEHTITDIIIYPVKSLGGIHLESSMAGGQGLRHDRNWMLVDVDGVAITQRQIPGLSLFRVGITKGGFSVSHPDEPIPLFLDAEMPASGTRQVKLFNDTMQAAATGVEANEWFSDLLHTSCSLVQATATMHRRVDPQFAFDGETTAFPDGFPVLVIGEASLADLNSRLAEPVPMDRFRPNLVFSGSEAFEEDEWQHIRIGEASLRMAKPCGRCVITTVNQQTGVMGKEPLKTLASYRTTDGKVRFGQNVVVTTEGRISLGDVITFV